MKKETPITIEWLETHGFEKMTGMSPVGAGEMYYYKLDKRQSIHVETTGGSLNIIHMYVYLDYRREANIVKPYHDIENNRINCFYVEELHYLLELVDCDDLIEFF